MVTRTMGCVVPQTYVKKYVLPLMFGFLSRLLRSMSWMSVWSTPPNHTGSTLLVVTPIVSW